MPTYTRPTFIDFAVQNANRLPDGVRTSAELTADMIRSFTSYCDMWITPTLVAAIKAADTSDRTIRQVFIQNHQKRTVVVGLERTRLGIQRDEEGIVQQYSTPTWPPYLLEVANEVSRQSLGDIEIDDLNVPPEEGDPVTLRIAPPPLPLFRCAECSILFI